jgi:hypothetical protein
VLLLLLLLIAVVTGPTSWDGLTALADDAVVSWRFVLCLCCMKAELRLPAVLQLDEVLEGPAGQVIRLDGIR